MRLTSAMMGLFVDLSVTASKSNTARSSISNANSGTSMVKPGRCKMPCLGEGNVTSSTKTGFSFCFSRIQFDGV